MENDVSWNPWYRGHANVAWHLLPWIYRPQPQSQVHPERERELLRDFKIRMSLEVAFNPKSENDWLFIGQHHGLPTRMLDWTENPLVALFFAVENNAEGDKDGKFYALHPALFNKHLAFSEDNVKSLSRNRVISQSIHAITVPTSDHTFFDKYVIDLVGLAIPRRPKAKLPMAFRPKSHFKRSMVKSGVFTIHGYDYRPIEKFRSRQLPIVEILVPCGKKEEILKELFDLNVNHGTLFGDANNVAKSIIYRYSNSYANVYSTEHDIRAVQFSMVT